MAKDKKKWQKPAGQANASSEPATPVKGDDVPSSSIHDRLMALEAAAGQGSGSGELKRQIEELNRRVSALEHKAMTPAPAPGGMASGRLD